MKYNTESLIFLLCICFLPQYKLQAWGFFGHKKITEWAIYSLPETELFNFYQTHQLAVIDQSIKPDQRKNVDQFEFCKHYLDADTMDLKTLWEKDWGSCTSDISCYSQGIVPFAVLGSYNHLVNAFRKKDTSLIIFHSGELAHYVSDMCVPLHTTQNYDGQENGWDGIHRFWETVLYEKFYPQIDCWEIEIRAEGNVKEVIQEVIIDSHKKVEPLYESLEELKKEMPNKVFGFNSRKGKLEKGFSSEFMNAFFKKNHILLQSSVQQSIELIAFMWQKAHKESLNTKDFERIPINYQGEKSAKIPQRHHE
ncbi:MAG: zinc dependent phospholipase C family protein [Flavobacteriales bacterium]|jgi:hypothetical protein|nr:zinc dependent phospholipase C family protein [Flavobacteriales bacterium]